MFPAVAGGLRGRIMRVVFAIVVSTALLFSCTGCGRMRGLLYGAGAPCAPSAAIAGPSCECAPGPVSAAMPWSGGMDSGVYSDGYLSTPGDAWSAGEWLPRTEPEYVPGTMNVVPTLPAPMQ